MTLTIELPPDVQQQLEQAAAEAGQAPAEYVQAVVTEKLASVPVEESADVPAGEEGEDPAITALRARYAAAGIQWSGKKLPDREPVGRTRPGPTVADLLIEDRR